MGKTSGWAMWRFFSSDFFYCFRTHCLTQSQTVIFLLDNKCISNISSYPIFLKASFLNSDFNLFFHHQYCILFYCFSLNTFICRDALLIMNLSRSLARWSIQSAVCLLTSSICFLLQIYFSPERISWRSSSQHHLLRTTCSSKPGALYVRHHRKTNSEHDLFV